MLQIEYDMARQYQRDRQDEAANYRLYAAVAVRRMTETWPGVALTKLAVLLLQSHRLGGRLLPARRSA